MNAEAETVRSELLVRQARIARVIELFRVQQLSTDAIAKVFGISEEQVCALLDAAERGGW